MKRILTNICSDHLAESKDFYTQLFDFEVAYDSDWFIQLVDSESGLELGIIDRSSDMIPKDFQTTPTGFYITLVVADADSIHQRAIELEYDIISPPEDMSYGQRRLLLKDPNGALIDVSSLIKDFEF
jgi:predicted enzyme related to lactoylglutathione lyase